MLTARGDVADRVAGLDAGADDYLAKPFALQELLARVRALLRRTSNDRDVLRFADLSLDADAHEVRRGDRLVNLTQTEYRLVELLLRHPRRVLTREILLERVWGYDFPTTSNSLDVYVGYVRRKLETDGESRLVHTVRGVGYVLREP
jgi:two-component system response regulator MprA